MIGLLLPIPLGLLAALLRGGSPTGWVRQRFHWAPLALAALAAQAALFGPLDQAPGVLAWGPWAWAASLAVVAAVLARNALAAHSAALRLAWTLAALGVVCNLLAVAANDGRMPQSAEARAVVGRAPVSAHVTALTNTRPLDADTRLPFLADVIPQPTWLPGATTISVGDLLLALGAGWWAFAAAAPVAGGLRRSHREPDAGPVPLPA